MITPLEFSILFTLKILEILILGFTCAAVIMVGIYLLITKFILWYRKHNNLTCLNCIPHIKKGKNKKDE